MKQEFYTSLRNHFAELESELNQLDSNIGDGDHGSTLLKGLTAILNSELSPDKAFRTETGGASGSLFSILIDAIDKGFEDKSSFGQNLTKAASKISMIGEAKEGDKTMLDALMPAARATLGETNDPFKEASIASKEGARKTINMSAKRGRAKYVENAGVGHMDPGAFSTSEMISFLYNYNRLENEKAI